MDLRTVFWVAYELRTTTPAVCKMAKAMGLDIVFENDVDCVQFPTSFDSCRSECLRHIHALKQSDKADKAMAKQTDVIRRAIQRDEVHVAKMQAEIAGLDRVLDAMNPADSYRWAKNRAKYGIKLAELEARQKRMASNQALLDNLPRADNHDSPVIPSQ